MNKLVHKTRLLLGNTTQEMPKCPYGVMFIQSDSENQEGVITQ